MLTKDEAMAGTSSEISSRAHMIKGVDRLEYRITGSVRERHVPVGCIKEVDQTDGNSSGLGGQQSYDRRERDVNNLMGPGTGRLYLCFGLSPLLCIRPARLGSTPQPDHSLSVSHSLCISLSSALRLPWENSPLQPGDDTRLLSPNPSLIR